MDEIFKYRRMQGAVATIAANHDKITASCIEENIIVFGTEIGMIYLLSLAGQEITHMRAHHSTITDIDVDNTGNIIASCSNDGKVVIHVTNIDTEDRHQVYPYGQTLHAICLDDDHTNKREKSYIVGTSSGQLLHHRQGWFSKRDVELFPGEGSPVTAITWRGDIVAWADATQVRLMDVARQTALCYLLSPAGVGIHNPLPCCLFWESEYDLLVGWGDNVRHLQLIHTTLNTDSSVVDIRAKTISDWQTDCIICGLSSFDEDHVLVLGYFPSEEDAPDGEDMELPELQLVKRDTGDVVAADVIPLQGEHIEGPSCFHMISDYECVSKRHDFMKWNLTHAKNTRGGQRGLSPICYIYSAQDVVVAKVRDINDRISESLAAKNVKLAVNLANSDRYSLKHHNFSELMELYMNSLLDADQCEEAAEECHRLLKDDALEWEKWIYKFQSRNRLSYIAPLIPTGSPRLKASIYELILNKLRTINTSIYHKWAKVSPPLFDFNTQLEYLKSSQDLYCIESKAFLYMMLKQFDKALLSYLDLEITTLQISKSNKDNTKRDLRHIFDLIEKQNLFGVIKDRILHLVRLSPELSETLLMRNIDKLPVYAVVEQLKDDRALLHWYLHGLFVNIPEVYNTQEYAEFHLQQIRLYVYFAPAAPPTVEKDRPAKEIMFPTLTADENDSDFLKFLKSSVNIQWDVALRECEKHHPPLHRERVYILARMGSVQEGLGVLLRDIGDVQLAISYVETHDPSLWADLVDFALSHYTFLAKLLDYIGMFHLNPVTLISKIPPCMDIPYLRERLMRLLTQTEYQVFARENCRKVLQEDTVTLLRKLNQTQRRGYKVNHTSRCGLCSRPLPMPPGIMSSEPVHVTDTSLQKSSSSSSMASLWGRDASTSSLIVFANKTAYHRVCFASLQSEQTHVNSAYG